MKKVLILAYDFPPFNSIGGQRPYSWYRYLKNKGYEPTVITRHWDKDINSQIDSIKPSKNKEVTTDKTEFGTIIRVPYLSTYRDKLILKHGFEHLNIYRKLITFYYNTFRYTRSSLDFTYPIYKQAITHLKENNYDIIIATGEPFILFKYANKLSKMFSIPWIADYRDGWSTNIVYTWDKSFSAKYSKILNGFFEKKIISTASLITTASDSDRDKLLSLHINKEVRVVLNGWDEDRFIDIEYISQNKSIFTIAYAGMIYAHQELECFMDGMRIFKKNNPDLRFQVVFYGANYHPEQRQRIIIASNGLEENIITTDRISHELVIKKLAEANLLLLLASTKVNHLAAKVYDYLAVNRRILLVKNDFGLLESFIENCNAGECCNDSLDVSNTILQMYQEFITNTELKSNSIHVDQYSRRNQSAFLSSIFNEVLNVNSSFLIGNNQISNVVEVRNDMRNLIFKVGYKLKFDSISRRINSVENSLPVLCFHNISDEANMAYPAIRVAVFEELMKYIKNNFDVISLDDIHRIKQYKNAIAITFDDGYKDFYTNALPILSHYQIPTTQHIVVECTETGSVFWTLRLNRILNILFKKRQFYRLEIGEMILLYSNYRTFVAFSKQIFLLLLSMDSIKRLELLSKIEHDFELDIIRNEIMTWGEIKVCMSKGVSIGSHSISHDSLTSIIDRERLEKEIRYSKEIIEKNLSTNISSFAFPNGLYNDEIAEICRMSGYKFLLNTDELRYRIKLNPPNIISRISVNKSSFHENVFKINSFHDMLHRPTK